MVLLKEGKGGLGLGVRIVMGHLEVTTNYLHSGKRQIETINWQCGTVNIISSQHKIFWLR